MGQQKGALKIKGTLGDITFSKGKYGYTVKEKSETSAEMRASSKEFAKFRQQQAEFGRSGKACIVVRNAFKEQISLAKDYRLSQRLQQLMMQVLKTDTLHRRGMRTASDGDLTLLEKFEFNINADWMRSISIDYAAVIDRAAGTAAVSLPGFIPQHRISSPKGSTHFRIVSAAAEIDLDGETSTTVATDSGLLPIDYATVNPLTLSNAFTPNSTLPVFLVLGIQFSEVVNGFEEQDVNGRYNALTIVKVDPA